MKRIYHTETGETLWRGTEYLVDGVAAPVDPPLVMLDEVDRAEPEFDPATHRLVRVAPFADLQEGEWVARSFAVESLTEEEIEAAAAALARKTWPNAAAFLAEFSMPELAAISLSTDPTIAAMRLLLASWPSDVWSDDPRIVGGLDQLVTVGIITSERRAAIVAKD